jgi:hypothetical protein
MKTTTTRIVETLLFSIFTIFCTYTYQSSILGIFSIILILQLPRVYITEDTTDILQSHIRGLR